MDVIKAQNLGFCSGVKLALGIAERAILKARDLGLPCYVYGDIVHNAYVMNELMRHGVVKIDSPYGYKPGVLIIRTHGISDSLRSLFLDQGFIIEDATCPVVLRNQASIRSAHGNILVIGIPGHSEVVSLLGANKNVTIIDNAQKLSSLDRGKCYKAVVQTTFSSSSLEKIKKKAKELSLDIAFVNSICASSELRREGVVNLKGKVDALIVVGDKHSANTNELFSIAKENGMTSFLVEKVDDITKEMMLYDKIGLAAGASTPEKIYNEVEKYLRSVDNGR